MKKVWDIEKGLLNNWVHQKGFKKQPYNQKRPPIHNIREALRLVHKVDLKKPARGHINAYRKLYEHSGPFPLASKRHKLYGEMHPDLQAYYNTRPPRKPRVRKQPTNVGDIGHGEIIQGPAARKKATPGKYSVERFKLTDSPPPKQKKKKPFMKPGNWPDIIVRAGK